MLKGLPRQNYEEITQQDATTQGSQRKKNFFFFFFFFIQAKYKMHTVQKLMYNIMQICQCNGEVKFESNMFFKAK